MSNYPFPKALLSRRHWLVLSASSLTACGGGGGGSDLLTALPGTGGTGIYVNGAISGFGSVIINGIKFDDTRASANGLVRIDGQMTNSTDLRLGMVAAVQGERATSTGLGTASRIDVWSVAQGAVTQVGSAGFTVAGMTVLADSTTVLDGLASTAAVSVGQRVTVWGLQAAADGRSWNATRIALTSAPDVVSTGVLSQSGSQLLLNGLTLTGTEARHQVLGTLIRVQGSLSADGLSLTPNHAQPMAPGSAASEHDETEIEGLVTTLPAASRFMLGNVQVDISATRYQPSTLIIQPGMRVEVYGSWQSGVLKATLIELQGAQSLHEVEIEARIEQFTSLSNFVLRGQRCDASAATISGGTAAHLKPGLKVKVEGSKAGEVLRVSKLEIDH